jgi:hypothetical protein
VTATLYSGKSGRPLEEVNRCSTRKKARGLSLAAARYPGFLMPQPSALESARSKPAAAPRPCLHASPARDPLSGRAAAPCRGPLAMIPLKFLYLLLLAPRVGLELSRKYLNQARIPQQPPEVPRPVPHEACAVAICSKRRRAALRQSMGCPVVRRRRSLTLPRCGITL